MLQDKEQIYFKDLLLKKMNETIDNNAVLESIKVDEHEKLSDLLDQAAWTHNSNITIYCLRRTT